MSPFLVSFLLLLLVLVVLVPLASEAHAFRFVVRRQPCCIPSIHSPLLIDPGSAGSPLQACIEEHWENQTRATYTELCDQCLANHTSFTLPTFVEDVIRNITFGWGVLFPRLAQKWPPSNEDVYSASQASRAISWTNMLYLAVHVAAQLAWIEEQSPAIQPTLTSDLLFDLGLTSPATRTQCLQRHHSALSLSLSLPVVAPTPTPTPSPVPSVAPTPTPTPPPHIPSCSLLFLDRSTEQCDSFSAPSVLQCPEGTKRTCRFVDRLVHCMCAHQVNY